MTRGRPATRPKYRRSKTIAIRVTEDEHRAILSLARERGEQLSETVRNLALFHVEPGDRQ